jgi:hypothetical protein
MNDEQTARLAALEAQGWKLIAAPSTDERHAHSRITAEYTLERIWNGRPIREPGRDLDHVLEVGEWQQRRLDQLDNRPTPIHTGLSGIND